MFSNRFFRFCIVGIINTLVDIAIFLVLRHNGLNLVVANIFSTSVALMVSLFLNYNYTFKETGKLTKTKLALYVLITLVGLWVLQPIVISIVTSLNNIVDYTSIISSLVGHENTVANLLPKLAATAVTLVWNFVLYGRYVFNSSGKRQSVASS